MSTREWFVVAAYMVTNSVPAVIYYPDPQRFPTREAAVEHGFTLGRSDDFNVAAAEGRTLAWFGWMDKPLTDDIPAVAKQLGLSSDLRSERGPES